MGTTRPELYDIVVVGGGPAGATAALRASRQGASVAVVEKEAFPRADSLTRWLGPAGVALCNECGLTASRVQAGEFSGIRLHSWDVKRSATIDDPELSGWLVDRARMDHALLTEATQAGANSLHGVTVERLELGEERAALRLSDGSEVAGKVLLIADGVASPTGRMANLVCAGQQPELPQCSFVQYKTSDKATRLEVAVGASRTGQLATVARFGATVSLAITCRAAQCPLDRQFQTFREAALEAGVLPEGAPGEPRRRVCPGGIALDMDTHVGKRCLLIGDAGGFVAAFSNEGIYPAMRSGWIAADTALRALQASVLQDELGSFGAAWRRDLADYLRMPNTDLSLLVPLVFNNEQMSRRVARAFLLGQAF